MRKLLFLSAAIAIVGQPAIAQSFESPDFDNSASIRQIGTSNDATIDQVVGGLINGQNSARILQRGDDNDAVIRQNSVTSPVSGAFDNDARITQRADGGDALIRQIHDYGSGNRNLASIRQDTDDAFARVRQRGDNNRVRVRQNGAATAPDARVQQNGSNNITNIDQDSLNGNVRVRQGDFSGAAGLSPQTDNSRVTVVSSGEDPFIRVRQYGFRHRADVLEQGVNGRVDILSEGDFNTADVTQYSTDGNVEIVATSFSFDNSATVLQEASDTGSEAFVEQSGFAGEVSIVQKDDYGGGGNNLADVSQSGLGWSLGDLSSTILQDGGDNTATVSQAADFAQSVINQVGVSHTASVSQ